MRWYCSILSVVFWKWLRERHPILIYNVTCIFPQADSCLIYPQNIPSFLIASLLTCSSIVLRPHIIFTLLCMCAHLFCLCLSGHMLYSLDYHMCGSNINFPAHTVKQEPHEHMPDLNQSFWKIPPCTKPYIQAAAQHGLCFHLRNR